MIHAPELRRALQAATSHRLENTTLAVLALLHEHGELTMTVAARHVGVSPATFTGTADRLEALGYAIRIYGRTDRRTLTIEITPRGVLTLESILAGQASTAVPTLGLRLTR